jgi:cell division protein FtsZ
VIDDSLGDEVKVTVIAAGFDKYRGSDRAGGGIVRTDDERPTEAPARTRLLDDEDDEEDEVFTAVRPTEAPSTAAPAPDGDDDLDVPSFLR